MVGLFGEEAGGEGLLVGGGDKDTAFGVFGAGAAVEADAGSAWDLAEDRQRALELRRVGDLYAVDESRDEVVGVLKGITKVVQALDEEAGTLVHVMRGAVELAGNGFSGIKFRANRQRTLADEFIIHTYFFLR